MPRQRVQINRNALPSGVVQPAARVRPDAFRPQSPAQTQAGQLAQALARIEPGLARFSSTLSARYAQSEFEKGKQAAIEAERSQKEVADLIKAGKLPPSASAWYRAGLMQEAGSILANKWHSDFIHASQVALKDATTMEEFDAFASDHLDTWMQDTVGEPSNKFLASGFDARRQAYLLQERTNFAHQAGARLAQQDSDQLHSNIFDSALNDLTQGVPLEDVAKWITGLLDERMKLNPLTGSANNLTASRAIVNLAKRMNDGNVLDMLDMIHTGPEGKGGKRGSLGSIAKVAELREAADNSISQENAARWSRANSRADRERYEQKLEVMDNWIQTLEGASNAHTVDASAAAEAMREVDPSAVALIYDVQRAYSDRIFQDNPIIEASAWERVYMYPPGDPQRLDKEDVTRFLGAREITVATARQLWNAIEQRDAGGEGSTILKDRWLQEAEQLLRPHFQNELGNLDSGENAVRFRNALSELRHEFILWRRGPGAEADDDAANNFITRLVDQKAQIWAGAGGSATRGSDVESALSELPGPQLGAAIDWHVQPITDLSRWQRLQPQFQGYLKGRVALSNQAVALLIRAGIDFNQAPDKLREEIVEFVQTQNQIMNVWEVRMRTWQEARYPNQNQQ